jgi:hypothetical protein
MPAITELPIDDLRVAGDAIETLIDLRAYLPADGKLLMLAGRFRDDIREVLGMPSLERPERGSKSKRLDELEDEDLDKLAYAVGSLVSEFRKVMDDPDLVRRLGNLNAALRLLLFQRECAGKVPPAAEEEAEAS